MPKPNKYAGNGSKKPEGTTEGPYVMHKGRMVHQFRASKETIQRGIDAYKAFKGKKMATTIARIMLVIVCAAFIVALCTGCSVNVINVIHSDIGVDAATETVNTIVKVKEATL